MRGFTVCNFKIFCFLGGVILGIIASKEADYDIVSRFFHASFFGNVSDVCRAPCHV